LSNKKIKVMKKLKYILKLHYVINHIIFDFVHNFNFFNKMNDQSWCKKVKVINIGGWREYIYCAHINLIGIGILTTCHINFIKICMRT
jgi:hypothetical protein